MVAKMKLIGAIMVTLFAMGFEAEAVTVRSLCMSLESKLSSTPGSDQLNPEELMSLAESQIGKGQRNIGNKLMNAWAKVVRGADCGKSSLQIVQTIAYCRPGSEFGNLHDATKEYARKCLGAGFWKDEIAAKSTPKRKSLWDADLKKFINQQFLLDSEQEEENCKKTGTTEDHCSLLAMRKSLVNAIARDLKGNIKKLKTFGDVYVQLHKRLYNPCSNLDLLALEKVFNEMKRLNEYIGAYDEFIKTLDSSAREDIIRYTVCSAVKGSGAKRMTQVVREELGKLQLVK